MIRVLTLIVGLLLCATSRGEWYQYAPQGSVDGKGIHVETMSRCPQYGLSQIRNFDKSTQCHEATHFINGEISQSVGQEYGGIYVGAGRCIILPAPRVLIGAVAQHVPEQLRTATYRTYLCGERVNRNVLAVLDEFACYTNDAQCTNELRLEDDGGLKRALEFCNFADAMVEAIKARDPQYAKLAELESFVDWQQARATALAGAR